MTRSTSDEVDDRQLELAERAGDAYQSALSYMVEEVAVTGDSRETGDYLIAFAQEEAEGMYVLGNGGDLEWRAPDEENCHVEVAVCDADDGRFLPAMNVAVTLLHDDASVAVFEPEFLWHPGLFHYGANVTLPGDGTYTIRVDVEPPRFGRHDRTNGQLYDEPVQVTFEDVELRTGQS